MAKKTTKKVVKKTAPKKTPKKVTKSAAAPKKGTSRTTIRQRVFELLAKHPDGFTGAQIMEKLKLGGIPSLLKDEGVSDKPRIRRQDVEGVRGVVYQLTAAGNKAVKDGTVDSAAPESAAGKAWPDAR